MLNMKLILKSCQSGCAADFHVFTGASNQIKRLMHAYSKYILSDMIPGGVCPQDEDRKTISAPQAAEIQLISSPQWAQAWRRRLADILPLSCDLCSDRGQRLAVIRPCVLITHSLYSFLPLIRAFPLCVSVSMHVFPPGL